MRIALIFVMSVAFLLANESINQTLKNDRIYHLQRHDFLVKNSWIAVNHTPDLIDIVSDEGANTLFVKANSSNGLGLIEVVLVKENRSIWLSFVLEDEFNYFTLDLEDKDPSIPAVISEVEDGASVRVGKKRLLYNGKRSGAFFVGYITNDGRYREKRFVVTRNGIVGFDAYVRLYDEATILLSSTNAQHIELIYGGDKGNARLVDSKVVYVADDGEFGDDKILLSIDGHIVPIKLHIYKRYSVINPANGAYRATYDNKESYYKDVNGAKHLIESYFDGAVQLSISSDQRKIAIRSNVSVEINATEMGGYNVALKNGEIRVADDGIVYGKLFENLFLIDSLVQDLYLLSDESLLIQNDKGTVLIDDIATRVANNDYFLATVPSDNEIVVDDNGAKVMLNALASGILLPIGIVYGEDDGALKRLDPVSNLTIKANWSGEVEAHANGKSFRSMAIKPRTVTVNGSDEWERFVSNGSSIDPFANTYEQLIEVGKINAPASWQSKNNKIPSALNTLFKIDSSKLYYAKGAKEGNMSVSPQTIIWRKGKGFVGVGSFVDSEIVLDNQCVLLDLSGEQIGLYEKEIPYILECN